MIYLKWTKYLNKSYMKHKVMKDLLINLWKKETSLMTICVNAFWNTNKKFKLIEMQ